VATDQGADRGQRPQDKVLAGQSKKHELRGKALGRGAFTVRSAFADPERSVWRAGNQRDERQAS
jgi:hypothetical protein